MSTPMEVIVPEIEGIVNFYTPELVEEIARETGFVQRESKLVDCLISTALSCKFVDI